MAFLVINPIHSKPFNEGEKDAITTTPQNDNNLHAKEKKAKSVLKRHTYLVLTPDIPNSKANVFVLHSLHIKS
jgi:hypothetical protein